MGQVACRQRVERSEEFETYINKSEDVHKVRACVLINRVCVLIIDRYRGDVIKVRVYRDTNRGVMGWAHR